MVEKSHEPFLELVLCNDHLGSKNKDGETGKRYSRRDIEDFLNGDSTDELLSVCFRHWCDGNTGRLARLLGAKAVTEVESKVDIALLEGKAQLDAREEKLLKKSKSEPIE